MNHKKAIAAAAASAAASAALAASLAGCAGNPQFDDLRGVNPVYPDYAADIMNVPGFPNVTLLCYDGQAMLTTTRNMDSIVLDPAMDNICQAHARNDIDPANGYTPPPLG